MDRRNFVTIQELTILKLFTILAEGKKKTKGALVYYVNFSWHLEKNMHPHPGRDPIPITQQELLFASIILLQTSIVKYRPSASRCWRTGAEISTVICQAFCSTTSYSLLYQTWKTPHHSCSKAHKPRISGQMLACYFHFSTINSWMPYIIYCSQKQKGSLILSPCLSSQHTT